MTVIKVADFYRELKKYPVEMGMVSKSWIAEIFNKIQFEEDESNTQKMESDLK